MVQSKLSYMNICQGDNNPQQKLELNYTENMIQFQFNFNLNLLYSYIPSTYTLYTWSQIDTIIENY